MFSTHGGQAVPIWTRGNFSRLHRFAAPRSKNNIWIGLTDLVWRDDTLRRGAFGSQIGKDVFTADTFNQFAHPGDAGNERFVPFLKINTRTTFNLCYWREPFTEFIQQFFTFAFAIYDACEGNYIVDTHD